MILLRMFDQELYFSLYESSSGFWTQVFFDLQCHNEHTESETLELVLKAVRLLADFTTRFVQGQ